MKLLLLVVVMAFAGVLLSGCVQSYVCPDGSTVSNSSLCPSPSGTPEETPPAPPSDTAAGSDSSQPPQPPQ